MIDDRAKIAQLLQVQGSLGLTGRGRRRVEVVTKRIRRGQGNITQRNCATPAACLAALMAQYFSIHPANPQARLVRQAAEIVRAGGVIAYPTDSSYAFGCLIGNADAMQRIRALRAIDDRHHLTLVCRDLREIGRYALLDNWQFRIVKQGVPGSYTFLLPATREVPRRLKHPRRSTIGVRVPEHAVVHALLDELGEPLAFIDADTRRRIRAAQRSRADPRPLRAHARPDHRQRRVSSRADDGH